MSSQLGAINSINNLIGKLFTQPKGDFAGRLNSRVTVTILGISAGLLLTTHFWGDPITCWIPAEFPKVWAEFVDQYCFVHGTYWAHLVEPLDYDKETRQRVFIDYYQWVPYVLAAHALFFYIPRFLWRKMAQFSGYDLAVTRVDSFERQAAPYLWDGIRLSRRRSRGQLVLYYVIYTLIQATNSTIMFMWLNALVGSPMYSWRGPSILVDLLNGLDWQETGHFPRITHCDFTKRKPASVQVNKILIFLKLYRHRGLTALCFPSASRLRLQAFLTLHSGAAFNLERFVRTLGPDGVFILHQISLNIGELPASYLTLAMYNLMDSGENESMHLLSGEKTPQKHPV
uniref:Innexin n=1 Tax=Meloidogyne floridensis TaxID=298350 RepID=A0A915PAE8_9BILA